MLNYDNRKIYDANFQTDKQAYVDVVQMFLTDSWKIYRLFVAVDVQNYTKIRLSVFTMNFRPIRITD